MSGEGARDIVGGGSAEDGLAGALVQSAVEAQAVAMAEDGVVASLQAQLDILEPGSSVERNTPKDGHCLFHALRRGGLGSLQNCPCALSVAELRGMALTMATQEQLTAAAASTDGGMHVHAYVEAMQDDAYGDNLMVSLLSVVFQTPITVITMCGHGCQTGLRHRGPRQKPCGSRMQASGTTMA